jgi:hypothetical protein
MGHNVDFRILWRMKKTSKEPKLWVSGKKYYQDLMDLEYRLGTNNLFYSQWGTRSLMDIPVQIGHKKVKDDEIVLLNRIELNLIRKQENGEN